MTNEKKAHEIAKRYETPCHGIGDCEFEAYQSALEAMEWKDEQYNAVKKTKIKNVFSTDKMFHIHFPMFLKEVIENSGQTMYAKCWDLFLSNIRMIAERATELHDPVLDAIMIKSTLYEFKNKDYEKLLNEC